MMKRIAVGGVAILMSSAAPAVMAQQASATQSVLCFEHQRKAYPDEPNVQCPDGVVPASGVLLDAQNYAPEFIDEVLGELAQLALTTTSDVVRVDAVQWLAFLGRTDRASVDYFSGIMARLVNLYEQADDVLTERSARLTKRMVIQMAGKQAETTDAAIFLEDVASRPQRHRTAEPMALLAVKALEEMGPAGAASLQRLRGNSGDSGRP